MTSNQDIAKTLNLIADLLEIQRVQFKPYAYRQAAITLEGLTRPIEDIYKEGKLEELPGIGKHIAEKIEQLIKTGKLDYLEKLKKEVPIDVESLTNIEGLGPKKIALLYKNLKIKNIEDLKKAAEQKKIQKIRGFGEKTEQQILQSVSFAGQEKRMLLPQAIAISDAVIKILKPYTEQITIAGSLLRRKETIGDIDLLATAKNREKLMHIFTSLSIIKKILSKGTTRSTIILKDNTQVDLRIINTEEFGSALQYFTGNKVHNIETRKIAQKKGYKLSEYGLFQGEKRIAGSDERDIYKKLGLQWIAPELREMTGEIEAAQKKVLPKLVELKDIQGDLHAHTNQSDGADSLEAMAKTAQSLGRKYLLITDHTGILKIAGGMHEKQILAHYKKIDQLNKKLKNITLLKGMEANIMDHGKIDIKDSILKQADLVVASIHTGFKNNKEQITKRLCNAMENKYVHIIAHPTGRLINKRQGYEFNLEKVFEKAKETQTALEINCQPDRLDLKDIHIKKAIEIGAKLVISTDAHSIQQLENMQYGVWQARRGWAEKKDVLNMLPLQKLIKYLKS